jgi:hypothetical protein
LISANIQHPHGNAQFIKTSSDFGDAGVRKRHRPGESCAFGVGLEAAMQMQMRACAFIALNREITVVYREPQDCNSDIKSQWRTKCPQNQKTHPELSLLATLPGVTGFQCADDNWGVLSS